jgi:hypothetical protein
MISLIVRTRVRVRSSLEHMILELITALELDELQSWLAVGTGKGFIDVWDLRFQLCIQGMKHPTGRQCDVLIIYMNILFYIDNIVRCTCH